MDRNQAVSLALRLNAGWSGRSEDLENYNAFIVDPLDFGLLETNANQLILGRRGTGKTLILGALDERINERFPAFGTYSLYYKATDFRSSAEFGDSSDLTEREKAHHYFQFFIEKLANDILALADTVIRKPGLFAALGAAGISDRDRRERLSDAVLNLVEAAKFGSSAYLPTSVQEATERIQSTTQSGSLSAGATYKPSGTGLNAGAGIGRNRSDKHEHIHTIASRRVFDPSAIRRLLKETIDLLGLEFIVILLDEWMSLDKCQTEFAERLRQCLFGEAKIAIKIAADQYQGRFNNAATGTSFRGLEVGADIAPLIDLDQPFRDLADAAQGFVEVLYRRLLYFHPPLEQSFGPPPLTNPKWFISHIFETQHAYIEACRASQGICRTFIELVSACSERTLWDTATRKITYTDVQDVLVERSGRAYDRAVKDEELSPLIADLIIPQVRDTGVQYFAVRNRGARVSSIVDDLLSKRLIHRVSHSQTDPSLKPRYGLYEIDYAIYIDLMRARAFTQARNAGKTLTQMRPQDITKANVESFLIDVDSIESSEAADHLNCPHCGSEFSKFEPSFKKKGYCPVCFEPVLDMNRE